MMVVEALVRGIEENHTTQYSFVRTQHQRHTSSQNDSIRSTRYRAFENLQYRYFRREKKQSRQQVCIKLEENFTS